MLSFVCRSSFCYCSGTGTSHLVLLTYNDLLCMAGGGGVRPRGGGGGAPGHTQGGALGPWPHPQRPARHPAADDAARPVGGVGSGRARVAWWFWGSFWVVRLAAGVLLLLARGLWAAARGDVCSCGRAAWRLGHVAGVPVGFGEDVCSGVRWVAWCTLSALGAGCCLRLLGIVSYWWWPSACFALSLYC